MWGGTNYRKILFFKIQRGQLPPLFHCGSAPAFREPYPLVRFLSPQSGALCIRTVRSDPTYQINSHFKINKKFSQMKRLPANAPVFPPLSFSLPRSSLHVISSISLSRSSLHAIPSLSLPRSSLQAIPSLHDIGLSMP
jgi:hypothetical protein